MAGSSALSSRHQPDKTLGISELNPSGDHRMRADARLSVPPHSNDAGSDTRTLPVTHLGDAKEVSLAELSRELEILEEERQIVKQKAAERARQRREEEERLEKERRERAALKLRELEERIAANKAQKEAESQSTSREARNKAAPRGKTDKTSSPAPRSGFGDARSGSVARNASLFKAGGAATKIDTGRRQRSRERPTGSLEAESWRDSKRMMLAGAESARQAARLHQAPERARSGPTIRGHESTPASQGGASTIALERPRAISDIRRLVAAEGVRDAAAGDTFKPELGRNASVSAERKAVKGPTGSITSSTRSSHLPTESHSERNASKTWRDASESDDHADVRFTNHSSAHPLRHGEISGGTHAAAVRLPLDVAALDERVLSTGPPSSWLNLPDAKITDDVAAIKGHRDRSEKIRREVPKRSATRAADGSAKWGLPDFPKPSFEDISRAFASTRPMMGSAPIAFGLAGLYSGNERASTESRETTMQAASTLAASSQRNSRDIDTSPGDVGATPSADHRNLSSSMTVSTATALAPAAKPNDATAGSESAMAPIASKASVTGSQLALSSSNESTFPREIPFHSDLRTDAPEFIPYVPYGSVGETGFAVAHADPAYISVQYGDAAQADLFSLPGYLPSSDWGSTVLSDSVDLQHLKDSDERGENAGPKRKTHMDDDDEDLAAAAISSALGEHRHRRGKTINDRRRERNSSMAPSRNQFQSESNTQVQAPSKLRERRWSLSAAARGNPTTSRPERRQSLALGPDANDRNEAQCTTQAGRQIQPP
ncbi:hypothetical protein F1559_002277 [Cyanidiococcus yangmingshanensis]|uniref:Uncharacterized protein n=1 Tax=Cyanidiococcus yangmingshanensis TaxID=2690220 RepID=A0A7J7IHE8_9RHOD|nr:hypothetical protein F1559_002277 [Cyanidiococcus yangmingshanensis]